MAPILAPLQLMLEQPILEKYLIAHIMPPHERERLFFFHGVDPLGRPPLGCTDRALRRRLSRCPRRVDGRCSPALDPRRPRAEHIRAAVGRVRLRARIRRAPAARRPNRRPAGPQAHAADRTGRFRRRVRSRRAGRRRHRAGARTLRQGPERGVHRARRPVDHHDDVPGGPGAQPSAEHLHDGRRERLLPRPGAGRGADRDRVALDVPARGAGRAGAAIPDSAAHPGRPRRGGRPARLRRARRGDRQRGGAAARHTVVEAPLEGWGSLATVGGFVGAAVLMAVFVAIELRSSHPLVRLGIFRSPSLVRANVLAMAMFGSYLGFQFIGTLYMQSLLGWSPIVTALAFLPAGLIVVFGSTRVGGLVDRFGTPRLVAVGFGLFAIGYALFLRIDETPVYAAVILPTIVLIGSGFALVFPSLNIQATAGVADNEQGLAGGLVNTSIQLGGAIGLAIVTAVVTSTTDKAASPSAVLDGFKPGLAVAAGIAVAGFGLALSGLRWRRAREAAVAEG